MMKRKKSIIWTIAIAFVVCIAMMMFSHMIVVNNAKGKLFSDIEHMTPSEYGLLLGTTPQTRIGRKPNQFFKFRIDAAEKLYKTGKIKKILVSGDENSLDGINEVQCMKDSLIVRGINASDIILDGKGFRTLDAVWRAVNVYNIKSFVVISQKFHNERAIYLAEHLPLDAHNITGFNAADATSNMAIMTYVREYFARVKVFLDIITQKKPMSCELDEANKSIPPSDTIYSFFGKKIILNDNVIEQITTIAEQDTRLSCEGDIIQICDVKWRINLSLPRIVLLTSVNPDEPKMKQVVDYLNEIYGDPYDNEDGFNIKWSSSPDSNDIFNPACTLVHFRLVRTEKGGTCLIFN